MALQADKLVFLTDTPGILLDRNEPDSLIRSLTPDDCRDLIARGVIDKGMIPKVEACLDQPGGRASRRPTSSTAGSGIRCSLEIYTDSGIGTEIVLRVPAERASRPCRRGQIRRACTEPKLPRLRRLPVS